MANEAVDIALPGDGTNAQPAGGGEPQGQPAEPALQMPDVKDGSDPGPVASGLGAPDSWLADLPDELKQSPTLQRFKSKEDVARSYLDARAKLGLAPVRMPGRGAKPEEWNEFYASIGRPESPDKYDLGGQPPEGVPAEFTPWFAQAAHRAGLTNQQAAAFYRETIGNISSGQQAQVRAVNSQREEAARNLRNSWGEKYAENLNSANKMFDIAFGGIQGAKEAVMESGLANNPAFIAAMHTLASRMGDDSLVGGDALPFNAMGPAEIQAKIDALMNDEAWGDDSNPRHSAVMKEITALITKQGGETVGHEGIAVRIGL